MGVKRLEDYTETDFLLFLKSVCDAGYQSEEEQIAAVLEFERVTEHPDGSDLIYYADSNEDATPEAVMKKVKEWRAANGKPGFKVV